LPFCRRQTANQHSEWKDVSSNSVLAHNGNGSYGTEERQRYNGTAQQNGEMATEWWKLGINVTTHHQLICGENPPHVVIQE